MDGGGSRMNEIATMDRTSGFVRTLVRMQLSQNRRSSQDAFDRLYERMKERGEEVDIEPPKLKRIREAMDASAEQSSATEDDDEAPEEAGVDSDARVRAKSFSSRASPKKELLRTSTGFLYTPRRNVRTPSPAKPAEAVEERVPVRRPYTVQSPNHGVALNRGLTLAESVKKNYKRFIRTDSAKAHDAAAEGAGSGGASRGSAKTGDLGDMEEPELQTDSVDCKMDTRKANSLCLPKSHVLSNRSKSSLGLTTTPEDEIPAEMARRSSAMSLPKVTSLPTTPEPRPVRSAHKMKPGDSVRGAQRVRNRLGGVTEGRFHKRGANDREERAEVVEELRKAQGSIDEHLKEARLRQARARVKAYKREQLLRAERMAIFQREMDDIMKRLRDINNRLDGRLRLLERDESLTKVEPWDYGQRESVGVNSFEEHTIIIILHPRRLKFACLDPLFKENFHESRWFASRDFRSSFYVFQDTMPCISRVQGMNVTRNSSAKTVTWTFELRGVSLILDTFNFFVLSFVLLYFLVLFCDWWFIDRSTGFPIR